MLTSIRNIRQRRPKCRHKGRKMQWRGNFNKVLNRLTESLVKQLQGDKDRQEWTGGKAWAVVDNRQAGDRKQNKEKAKVLSNHKLADKLVIVKTGKVEVRWLGMEGNSREMTVHGHFKRMWTWGNEGEGKTWDRSRMNKAKYWGMKRKQHI